MQQPSSLFLEGGRGGREHISSHIRKLKSGSFTFSGSWAPESGEVKIGNYAFPDIFGNAYFPNMSGNCPFPDEISLRWVAWAQTILLLFKSPSCLVCVKIEVNFKVLARKSTYFSVEYEDEDQNLIFVKISLLNILSPFACSKSWRTRPARPHVLPAVVRLPLPSLLLVNHHQ